MKFQTTGPGKVSSVSCCLLFDPKNGAIRHVHRIVTMEGAQDTSKAELEATTLRLAKDMGLDTGKLEVLHIDPAALAESGRYSVDLASRKVVKQG